jgi:hypothetical protein
MHGDQVAEFVEGIRRRGMRTWWSENLQEKEHLEHVDIDGRIILKWIILK